MRFLIIVILATAWVSPAAGQAVVAADTVQVFTEIEVRDGSRYVGTVVTDDHDVVVLRTLSGTEIRIPKGEITARRAVQGRVTGGEFRRFDPNYTRLLFAPTARSLKGGSGYLAGYYVFFGFVAVGVSDNVTIGGGTWMVPGALGELWYVAPKVQLAERGNGSFSVGSLIGVADSEAAGIAYGVWTKGYPDRAVTLGGGLAFGGGEWASDPVVVLGVEQRMSQRTKFVGEAYAIPTLGAGALLMGGVRFIGSGLAADLGFLVAADGDGRSPAIPWLSFAYNFGR